MQVVGHAIDARGRGSVEHGDELEAVVKIDAHPLGFEQGGIGALEEDDVLGSERLLDGEAGEKADRLGDLADEAPEVLGGFAVGFFHVPLRGKLPMPTHFSAARQVFCSVGRRGGEVLCVPGVLEASWEG